MHRITYVLVAFGLLALGQDSYALCKRCNETQYYRRVSDTPVPSYYRGSRNIPTSRDTSYLPEENYEDRPSNSEESQLDRDNRNLMPEYRNLCEIVTKRVELLDDEFDYQPPHYHEVYCKSYSLVDKSQRTVNPSKQKCAHPGFHCVQRSRTLFLARRRWDSECWEPFTREIPSGCDCMWPVSVLGDITGHY